MNIPSEKMPGYKHESVRDRAFKMSKRLKLAELVIIVYHVNRMSKKVGIWLKLNVKLTF